ncbi:hypothetical protein [Lentilactobacillus senioris]|uniref:hypothetical protein n=1 Tax=Lentilactobacillus senioris TaxID=931534 RepID=UPI0006D08C30|nr:hypothetical protein [Lentilactobacillus senioris]
MESHQPKQENKLAKILNAIVLVLVIIFILMFKSQVVNTFIGWGGMSGFVAQVIFFALLLLIFFIASLLINFFTKDKTE